MYLHIGNGKSLKKKQIRGIFDLDTATVTRAGKEFINKKEKEGSLIYEDFDLPRSFVLTEDGGESKVYLSRISSHGLRMRAEENKTELK